MTGTRAETCLSWGAGGSCGWWKEALSNLWLRAEASGGEEGWMLGSGVGGSLCAFQSLLPCWPG